MTPISFNPGDKLPNGAIVITASAAKPNVWVVLAMRPGFELADAYVTWECNRPGDGSDTRWGHYFNSITDAAKDFFERAAG